MATDNTQTLRTKVTELKSALDHERAVSSDFRAQVERLSQEIAIHKSVRAEYCRVLNLYLPPSEPFTQEEIDELIENGVGSDQIFQMLEELETEEPVIVARTP